MTRRVFKYATGQPVPDGAIHCGTVTQTSMEVPGKTALSEPRWITCWLVWHYFLVEADS